MRITFLTVQTLVRAASLLAGGEALAIPFTFQGELRDGGTAVNGVYDMQFSLFGVATGGTKIGDTQCADNVTVTNGRFTVVLDFGNTFDGTDRFLAIDLRADTGLACDDSSGFATFTQRAQVTIAPHAGFAMQAGTAANATSASSATNAINLNGQPSTFYQNATNLTGTLSDARLSGNVPRLNSVSSTFTGAVNATSFTGSGAALTSLNATNLSSGTVADARLSSNIPRLNASNAFTGALTATAFIGSGASLTGLNVSNVSSGTLGDGFLSANVPLMSGANTFSATNIFNNRVGIGTTPAVSLHVSAGASGASPSASSELVIEDNANSYIQMLTPDANERGIAFGSPAGTFEGGIYYTNTGGMTLRTGGNNTRMTIGPTGDVGFTGTITIPPTLRYETLSGASFTVTSNMIRIADKVSSAQNPIDEYAYAPVRLPHGARVTSMAVYGSDGSPTNFNLRLRLRELEGVNLYRDLVSVSSSGSSGTLTWWTSSSVNYADIDNATKSYFLILQIPANAPDYQLEVVAIRITYTVTAPLP
ncbi:MAG: hypothetical protein KGS45_00425 [Planctomycetes bacterium]|nr:hypothetical protein [Planctomycetota bacterium]